MLEASCARCDGILQHPQEPGTIISPLLSGWENQSIENGGDGPRSCHKAKEGRAGMYRQPVTPGPTPFLSPPATHSAAQLVHVPSRGLCDDANITDEETEAQMLRDCPKAKQLTAGAHLAGSPVSQGSATLLEGKNPVPGLLTVSDLALHQDYDLTIWSFIHSLTNQQRAGGFQNPHYFTSHQK